MEKHDRAALTLAMEICRAEEGRAEQLNYKMRRESWAEVAQFAAYVVQSQSLNLAPWESPPCWGDSERCDPNARKLLQQMLALGVSQWHPDPLAAIEEAKRKGTA